MSMALDKNYIFFKSFQITAVRNTQSLFVGTGMCRY